MKKLNICSIALLLLLLVGCALLLLSCNEAVDPCANGHTEVTDTGVPATCTASGLSDGKHCSVCNKVLVAQEWINKLDHTASEWQTTLGATCGQSGSQYRKCTACDVILETKTVEAIAHQYGEPQTIKAPSCFSAGEQNATCTLCGDVKVTEISALSHESLEWKTDSAHPATCTQNGLEVRTCKHCSTTLELRVVQKLAHTYPEVWTTTIPPTCAVMGRQHRSCTVCGYTQSSDLPTTAHTPGEWTTILEATATTDGSKTQSCTVCLNVIKMEITPATNAPVQLTYTVSENEATVTGYTIHAKKALVIPEELGGYPVVRIAADAFANAAKFTSITLPSSLKQIEVGAFEGCTALVPTNHFTMLGDWLISVDREVGEITVPATVKKIADGAFTNCLKLVHITNLSEITLTDLPANAGLEIRTSTAEAFQNTFATKNGITTYTVGSTVYLFAYEGNDDTLDLKDINVHAVYALALLNNETVKTLIIPPSLTDIGKNAFGGCTIESLSATIEGLGHVPTTCLKELIITGSPIELPSNFLNGCSTLESLSVPATVLVTRKMALEGCINLKTLNAPANMLSQEFGEFCSKLEKLTVNGGTSIPSYAFYKHATLKEVHIAPSVTTIGAQAFMNCYEMELFVFDDIEKSQLTTIGNYQFCSNKKLESIVLPEGLTSIPSQCFSGCSGLTSVTIPKSVTTIKYEAFQGCTSLLSITIPASVVTLESHPDSNVRGVFENCTKLETVIFEENSRLTLLSNYCFYNCKALTAITIPASVTSIGKNAFSGSGITSITFTNTANWKLYKITNVSSQVLATGFQNLGAGTAITISSPADNAINLGTTYKDYVWKRG